MMKPDELSKIIHLIRKITDKNFQPYHRKNELFIIYFYNRNYIEFEDFSLYYTIKLKRDMDVRTSSNNGDLNVLPETFRNQSEAMGSIRAKEENEMQWQYRFRYYILE